MTPADRYRRTTVRLERASVITSAALLTVGLLLLGAVLYPLLAGPVSAWLSAAWALFGRPGLPLLLLVLAAGTIWAVSREDSRG